MFDNRLGSSGRKHDTQGRRYTERVSINPTSFLSLYWTNGESWSRLVFVEVSVNPIQRLSLQLTRYVLYFRKCSVTDYVYVVIVWKGVRRETTFRG